MHRIGGMLAVLAAVWPLSVRAQAPEVGTVLLCRGTSPERDVLAWVGKVDPQPSQAKDVLIVSLSLMPLHSDGFGPVGQAPFDLAALVSCAVTDARYPRNARRYFDEGYTNWRTEFEKSKAGYWTLSPSDAYWTMQEMIGP